MSHKRNPLTVLGRTIGTYDGWDGDEDCMVFYSFKPNDVLSKELPEGDLTMEYTEGYFSFYEGDGELQKKFDILNILNMVQRDRDGPTVQS